MDKLTLIRKAKVINRDVNRYFQSNPKVTEAKPKDLMPFLIKGGVFSKDHRSGLPLRNILRRLDENSLLHLLPLLRVERKTENRFWYFTTARHHKNEPGKHP